MVREPSFFFKEIQNLHYFTFLISVLRLPAGNKLVSFVFFFFSNFFFFGFPDKGEYPGIKNIMLN